MLQRRLTTERLIFLYLLLTYAYFFQGGGHNEASRFSQVRAIAERGELHSDSFPTTSFDVIEYDGKTYSNKAPGSTFIAVPAWVLSRKVMSLLPLSQVAVDHFVCYLTTVLTAGIATAWIGALLYRHLCNLLGSALLSLLVCVGYSLGTIAFPFATLFFSHQISAALLFFSYYLVHASRRRKAAWNWRIASVSGGAYRRLQILGAGGLSGLAFSSEYPTAIGGAALFGLVWMLHDERWPMAYFAVGFTLLAMIVPIYGAVAFGEPLFVPYMQHAESTSYLSEHREGFVGLGTPHKEAFLGITIGWKRGLLPVNPWLILGIPALAAPFLIRRFRAELFAAILIVVGMFIFNSGYGRSIVFWGGGYSVGPRHLLPALPFLAVVVGSMTVIRALRVVTVPLVVVSVATMLMATAVEPLVSYGFENPLVELFIPNFLEGSFSLLDRGVFSVALLTSNSVAFNLGELASLPGFVQLLPLLLIWWIGAIHVIRRSRGDDAREGGTASRKMRAYSMGGVGMVVIVLGTIPVLNHLKEVCERRDKVGLEGVLYRGMRWSPVAAPRRHALARELPIMVRRIETSFEDVWWGSAPQIPDRMSAEWSGWFLAEAGGEHTFEVTSDDGSALYIDGELVVDNWGVHARRARRGVVNLEKGNHPIYVVYFNRDLGGGLSVNWKGPHGSFRPMGRDVLRSAL